MATAAGVRSAIQAFFKSERVAVVGASPDKAKFGNKVLRALVSKFGPNNVIPVNPKSTEIEGLPVQSLSQVLTSYNPATTAISIITPPAASLQAVKDAIGAGVTKIWLQPGAENSEVLQYAQDKGVKLIAGGPCVLVELGFSDHF